MVSTKDTISIVHNGGIVEEYSPPIPDFHYIFPLYGIYFLTTKTGSLYWSTSRKFEQYESFSLFTNSPFNLICRNGKLLAYSSFDNVLILKCIR